MWSSYCAARDPSENVMVASLWIRCQRWGVGGVRAGATATGGGGEGVESEVLVNALN